MADEILAANPCKIRGGGTTSRAGRVEPATLDHLATLVTHMPDRYQALVHPGAWCGLRFGEMAELRRADLDLTTGLVHIRRGVVRVRQVIVGTPKSSAGIRDVAIRPHLIPALEGHLATHVAPGHDALVFPSVTDPDIQIHPNTLYRHWYRARDAAG